MAPITGTWLPKGSKPQHCPTCKAIVYRVWSWSEKKGYMDFCFFDCNGTGNVHPTSRRGGAGRPHACQKKAA